jgi:spore maturation protein CgeB
MVTYGGVEDLVEKVKSLLADEAGRHRIAAAGNEMVRTRYSKERQWQDFLKLL